VRADQAWSKLTMRFGLLLIMGLSMYTQAGLLGLGSTSWREEVLLHDGQKMIVERSQAYGGRSEPGKAAPIMEHTIRFTPPGSSKAITWTSEYSEDVGRANLQLLAVHVLNGTPYVVATPNLCLSYNKWGRPNPPYVIFKREGSQWRRIALDSLPSEFQTINVVLSIQKPQAEKLSAAGLTSAETIAKANRRSEIPQFRHILRAPIVNAGGEGCEEMVSNGKGGWLAIDWFKGQPNFAACLKVCAQKGIGSESCPCSRLFREK
jgi:hypothetical protein